jgi:hypothetical protein
MGSRIAPVASSQRVKMIVDRNARSGADRLMRYARFAIVFAEKMTVFRGNSADGQMGTVSSSEHRHVACLLKVLRAGLIACIRDGSMLGRRQLTWQVVPVVDSVFHGHVLKVASFIRRRLAEGVSQKRHERKE